MTTELEQRIIDVTIATGRVCLVGKRGDEDTWIAICDELEVEGDSGLDAVTNLIVALLDRAQTNSDDAAEGKITADDLVRSTGVLLKHLQIHTE